MSTITTRAGKGSQLTWTEVDGNFTNLNTDKIESSNAGSTGQILTKTSGGAEWATPAGGGNNIIIISTADGQLSMPSTINSNATSSFSVTSNGGVSGVSATTGTFTLPAGTYIMDFPFSTAATTTYADLYLRDTTNNNDRVTLAGEEITIVSTSRRRFSGRYTFTLPGSSVMSFRNESAPGATWNLLCGVKSGSSSGLRFAVVFYKVA
jgi:hypothetical protein